MHGNLGLRRRRADASRHLHRHHQGNIYRRRDGRWAARVSVGYRNGKRARRWVYGKTRAAVADKMRTMIQAHQEGVLVAPARQTVAQYLTTWLADSAKGKLRPSPNRDTLRAEQPHEGI
jgi:hypothetical protein